MESQQKGSQPIRIQLLTSHQLLINVRQQLLFLSQLLLVHRRLFICTPLIQQQIGLEWEIEKADSSLFSQSKGSTQALQGKDQSSSLRLAQLTDMMPNSRLALILAMKLSSIGPSDLNSFGALLSFSCCLPICVRFELRLS